MGISIISPSWIGHLISFYHHELDICGHFCYYHYGLDIHGHLSDSHHHRLDIMCISIDSPPQISIYGHFSDITNVDLHLQAFQFSVQSLLFTLASRAIFFLVQHLQSVFSSRATTLDIHDHQHCTLCPHNFTFHHTSQFVAYAFLTSSSYYYGVSSPPLCTIQSFELIVRVSIILLDTLRLVQYVFFFFLYGFILVLLGGLAAT